MAIDYNKMSAIAKKLITESGRTILLIKPPNIKTDPNKPWLGSSSSSETAISVPAIQVLPNAVRIFGLSALGDASELRELLSNVELVYVIYQQEINLHQFTFVRDFGVDYHIVATQALKPANTTLLGFIGVRR